MLVFNNNCDIREDSYVAIRLTRKCDNDCIFCSAKGTAKQQLEIPNIDAIVQSVINLKAKDIVIEGGEPLLFLKETLELVEKIRQHVDTICIYSAMPFSCNNIDTLSKIIDKVDHINFSILHYDFKKSALLRNRPKDKFNRLSILSNLAKKYPQKIRVSFNLVEGYLDTYEDLIRNIEFFYNIGIKFIRISELLQKPELYVSLNDLMKGNRGSKYFKSPYAFGCKFNLPISDIIKNKKDCTLTFRRACFLVENSLKASIWDIIKMFIKVRMKKHQIGQFNFKVILDDGSVHDNWNDVEIIN